MNRRQFLRVAGVAALGGVAGCSSGDGTQTEAPPNGSATQNGTTRAGTTQAGTTEPRVHTQYRSRERYRSPGEEFDAFEDLSRWRVVEGDATQSDRSFAGEASAKLVGPGGSDAVVERSLAPTDFSDRDVSVAVRTTTPLDLAFFVRLIDADGNFAALELRKLSYQPPDVGWFRTCPGVFGVSDQPPDFGRIDRMQLVVKNASQDDVELWVDDVRTHSKPEKGYLIFSWDDGRADYYEKAAPLHDEYGLPGVVTMPPTVDNVGQSPFMSLAEFEERQSNGDEVVAHGTVGRTFNTVSASKLDAMLERKKRWLVENGFDGADFVVYPANNFDATALDVLGRYFLMGGMNQAGNINTTGVHGFDPLVLPRTIGHDLSIAKSVADRAATYRNCGILNFHHFDADNTMSRDDYAALLDYAAALDGLEVITFADLWSMRTD